jgi:hypothetical protein
LFDFKYDGSVDHVPPGKAFEGGTDVSSIHVKNKKARIHGLFCEKIKFVSGS